jgi:hypothetical protein
MLRAESCFYEIRAAWVCVFRRAGRRGPRISAKTTRRVAKAVRMPNANAPRDARINIAKSSKFAIATASPVMCVYGRKPRVSPLV